MKGRFKRFIGRFIVKSVVASILTKGKAPWSTETPMNIVEKKPELFDLLKPKQEKPIMEKNFLKSKTLQGIAVMLVPAILKLVGVEASDGETNMVINALPALTQAAGAIWAVIGRFRAEKDLTIGPAK